MQKVEIQGRIVVDGPGLNDPTEERRAEVAKECTNMLRFGAERKRCKIVFVYLCHQTGRINTSDRTTLRLILEAAGLELDNSYGIIMNMCSNDDFKDFKVDRTKRHEFMVEVQEGLPRKTEHCLIQPQYSRERAETTLRDSEDLLQFLRKVPEVELDSNKLNDIAMQSFDKISKELAEREMEVQAMKQRIAVMNEDDEKRRQEVITAAQQDTIVMFVMATIATIIVMLPFIGASLGFPVVSATLPPLPLPFGWSTSLELGTIPLYFGMTFYKLASAARSWRIAKYPEQEWNLFGRRMYVGICGIDIVLQWHVWFVTQAYDAMTDANTWRALQSAHAQQWMSHGWAFTLLASIAVPLSYAFGWMTFDFALVCEGMFEDVGQTFISIARLAELEGEVPPAILFSALFAVLGVVDLLGGIRNRMLRVADARTLLEDPLLAI